TVLSAGRWLSPTGKEATIVSSRFLAGGAALLPHSVSCPAVAKDAHLPVGQFIVDPQLRWHDLDGRHLVVSPALGLRVSVRTTDDGLAKYFGRLRNRPCLALIESLATGDDPFTPAATAELSSLVGTHPAIVSRWPVPVTTAPEPAVTPATRPVRLATGPAAFLREDTDDRYDRADPAPV
ncbi:MAG TPA: hypothetical protein VFN21_03815, partial [Acidimicrobiales bacterium]|nr:hypothetical protein [Acidimicrobiales bacterium]